MTTRKAEQELWDSHKEELQQLREIDSETLQSVMQHMKSRHGFDRSKPQYDRVFKKWRFKKRNISKKEWKYIDSRILEREANGRHLSTVKIHGVLVPDAKVKKQRRNYAMTSFERQQLLLKISPRPVTPPGIEIYTPLSLSPPPQVMSLDSNQAPRPSLSMAMQENMRFLSADRIPWRHFLRLLSTVNISAAHDKSGRSPNQAALLQHGGVIASSVFEDRVEDLFWTQFLSREFNDSSIHSAFYDPTPYMAPQKDSCSDINLKSRNDLSPLGRQVELLKHVVYLLSNNFSVSKVAPAVVEFAREAQNREFLARFISSGLPTVEALAHNLLIPAAEGHNFPLLTTLLRSGVDIDYEGSGSKRHTTLLKYAVASCDEELLRFALENGACPRISNQFEKRGESFPLLNLAIRKANVNILNCLIRYLEDYPDEMDTDYDEYNFITAAVRGDVAILDLLISKRPRSFEGLRETPWVLYEAAALGGNLDMLKSLRAKDLDIRAKNGLNHGSPLVYALLTYNTDMADYLLEAGFKIDSYACTDARTYRGYTCDCWIQLPFTFRKPGEANKYAPIHCAICIGDIDFVRRLITKGANPNQPGVRFPIQLAACSNSLEMVQLLLKAGACVDYVSLPHSLYSDSFVFEDHKIKNPDLWYESSTPEKSAIQIALERGKEELFNLLFSVGACLPTTPSCACMRRQDALYNRHKMPRIPMVSDHQHRENNFCTCGRDDSNDPKGWENECIWNPLMNAASGKNKELFSRVLEIAVADNMPWITTRCITKCLRNFDGEFINQLIARDIIRLSPPVYREMLLRAINENAKDTVERILQAPGLNHEDIGLAFRVAMSYEREGMVSAFLETGWWPDDRVDTWRRHDMYPRPPLQEALQSQNQPIVHIMSGFYRKLISRAQDPTIMKHLMQAYGIAIRCGHIPMTQMLADAAGVDNVLYWALSSSDQEMCYLSAVHLAAASKEYSIVHWLLDHGADPNTPTEHRDDGYTEHSPLQCASKDGEIAVVERLLKRGVDVNAEPAEQRGATALQFAAITGRFDIANLLLDAGANVNAPPGRFEGRSAIEGAAEAGRMDMTSYLLELGAGEGMKGIMNDNFRRAVYRAWENGHHTIARMLHKWKAENDPDYSDHDDSIKAVLATMPPMATQAVFEY
ncbi:ankyrin [Byssothecium circinans]|uniref:Ankyrin n=1 Tax=Byssothecium circinans TaxID=147558 RepID=A0A6A5TDC6_9PLEO|nr:ankyrin [Byssothecium circinans]